MAWPSTSEDQQPAHCLAGCVRDSSAPTEALSETSTGALVCHRSDAHLGCRPFRPRGNAAFGEPVAQTHRVGSVVLR